jgi:hypothetical protein
MLLLHKYPPVDDPPAENKLGKIACSHILPVPED